MLLLMPARWPPLLFFYMSMRIFPDPMNPTLPPSELGYLHPLIPKLHSVIHLAPLYFKADTHCIPLCLTALKL